MNLLSLLSPSRGWQVRWGRWPKGRIPGCCSRWPGTSEERECSVQRYPPTQHCLSPLCVAWTGSLKEEIYCNVEKIRCGAKHCVSNFMFLCAVFMLNRISVVITFNSEFTSVTLCISHLWIFCATMVKPCNTLAELKEEILAAGKKLVVIDFFCRMMSPLQDDVSRNWKACNRRERSWGEAQTATRLVLDLFLWNIVNSGGEGLKRSHQLLKVYKDLKSCY